MMMLNTVSWLVPTVFLLASPSFLSTQGVQDPTEVAREGLSASESKKAEGWIRDLGSENFETRDAARKHLFEMGDKVIPLLDRAATADDPEVRWNARKLVRDLERARVSRKDEPKRDDTGVEDEGTSRLRKDGSTGTPQDPKFDDFGPSTAQGRNAKRSQSMSVDADGHVTITVEEDVDGKLEKKTYEADSMDELREQHPELFSGMDIRIGSGKGGFRFDVPGRGLPGFDDKEIEKLFEGIPGFDRDPFVGHSMDEMRRRIEEIEKRFRNLPRVQDRVFDVDRSTVGVDPQPIPENERLGVMIKPLHAEVAQFLGLDPGVGLIVDQVLDGSLAKQLGLKAKDVLVSINGRSITSPDVIRQALRETPVGGAVHVETLRVSGDRVKVTATRPRANGGEEARAKPKEEGKGTLRRDR